MNGKSPRELSDLFKKTETPLAEEAEESEEMSDRCGIVAKNPQTGIWVQFDRGHFEGISYGSIERIKFDPSKGIVFRYGTETEGSFEVTIIGHNLHEIGRQLTLCTRATLHANGDRITSISAVAVRRA